MNTGHEALSLLEGYVNWKALIRIMKTVVSSKTYSAMWLIVSNDHRVVFFSNVTDNAVPVNLERCRNITQFFWHLL